MSDHVVFDLPTLSPSLRLEIISALSILPKRKILFIVYTKEVEIQLRKLSLKKTGLKNLDIINIHNTKDSIKNTFILQAVKAYRRK